MSEDSGEKRPRPAWKSRRLALGKLDGRTREAKLMRDVRAQFVQHVGGRPSAAQVALIDRAAWLTLYLAKLEDKTAAGGMLSEHDSRQYLAWNNALTRLLRQLGLKGAADKPPSLADHLAARSAARQASAA